MLSNIFHSKETGKSPTLKYEINDFDDIILNHQQLTQHNYYNPVTFLYPELITNGKIDLTKTFHFVGCISHALTKILLIGIFCLELKGIFNELLLYQTILLVSLDFWITKNYSGRKLIGLTWWILRDDKQDLWYFEKLNKLYPLNRICIYYFWYCLYIFQIILILILILLLISCRLKQSLIIMIPIIINMIQIQIYSKTYQENETLKYLQDLTDYRMRRSIKCQFQCNIFELTLKFYF